MRKIIAMLSAFGLLFLAGCQESSSIGIIGGADGPTAIFVASAPLPAWIWALAAVGVAAVAIIVVLLIKKRNK